MKITLLAIASLILCMAPGVAYGQAGAPPSKAAKRKLIFALVETQALLRFAAVPGNVKKTRADAFNEASKRSKKFEEEYESISASLQAETKVKLEGIISFYDKKVFTQKGFDNLDDLVMVRAIGMADAQIEKLVESMLE